MEQEIEQLRQEIEKLKKAQFTLFDRFMLYGAVANVFFLALNVYVIGR